MIKAVIFDMDGLMFDTERVAYGTWMKVGDELNHTFEGDFLASLRGMNYEGVRNRFVDHYGDQLDYDAIMKRRTEFFQEEITRDGLGIKKGLMELLEYLKENKYKIALGTSSRKEVALKYLTQTKIEDYFDLYVCGDMVTKAKPDPEIFLTAAREMGEKPMECMVLEDSINGIKAAIAGGFQAVMVPDLMQPTSEIETQLTAKCDSLLDVIELLRQNK